MNVKKKESLADNIAELLTTAPGQFDDEDDANHLQMNRLSPTAEEDVQEEEILSKFRKKNVDLLGDIDEKYAGKKASRRDLKYSGSEVESEDEEESEDQGEESIDGGDDLENEEEVSDDEEEEEEDDDNDESDFDNYDIEGPEDDNFKTLKDSSVSSQLQKAQCVRNQMAIWENLLETRIQLQKCVSSANKMPNNVNYQVFKKEFENEFVAPVNKVKKQLSDTLDKMLILQDILLKKYPETKKYAFKTKKDEGKDNIQSDDDDDEEIPSDTDEEKDQEEENEEIEGTKTTSKKRKLQDYEADIDAQFKKFKPYWNGIIQKWNEKTRIASKNDTQHSILNQIEYNLANKDKLIRKTQLKRSQYKILGENDDNNELDQRGEEYNSEIYDDDDFYHQLLRELIEFKSSDITDPIQLGRQWIQLQNLRSKMKRKIDTKATKGRKIRYAVHNKLVNFMAPIDENLWTDEAKSELYNSLFGKNQPAFTQ